ncbi:DUF1326 domain-containing protein [Cupriavidus alkaliphilus]|uniref:DUF1326 domain-containing protein n=1 Tax=Cupriavidus alkaliphilus TaxID=942866 RepID=A0A1C3UVF1_9BURK|nr:DUF1326 domain-containing protein [Cupriavidus alkaliphilus]MBB3007286.1 hypothetical protein [Cupriavidus alkaliphilus]MBB3013299.1 hypothetical protein [Cupriavidus alkaliphilus]PVY77887.1 hypothetical protein C7414_107217 [Cupriavidus alkaliphilus]RAS03449.1 hypothetical protein C7415_11170 [Cupriavidus alkaliphilus]SCB19419.1 hypothetical protein GA0116996_104428 [Cupriavidus alkaliphilus]
MTPWEIQGTELINCNCSYGCPCQFNALPSNGFCEAMGAISISAGHYGEVRLDGLNIAVVFQWPGPIHEGRGKCQPIVDERAAPEQREALLKIMTGQDTEPFATMFAVFASTLEQAFDPIFTKIDFEADVDARRGRIHVEGVFDTVAEPIRNLVTGDEHRVRIDLPHGFEYELAEIGSGTSRSQGNIALDLNGTYAQFARLHMNNKGLIRHRTAA